jgi:methylated-DNA-protein-cysteine methyltransferase-like protein
MVGWAMHATPGPEVPAHRVVNSQGLLTGKIHFTPPSAMEKRLKAEGVKVKDDKVVKFKELYWDPAKELR